MRRFSPVKFRRMRGKYSRDLWGHWMGASRHQVRRWERGHGEPSFTSIVRLLESLDTPERMRLGLTLEALGNSMTVNRKR
jgi:DNA-binding transcriptional regulator YiaG